MAPTGSRFAVACSKGTYVRVLAEDIGAALGTAAHLDELRRTGFGQFHDRPQPSALEDWERGNPAGLLGVREALPHLPVVSLGSTGAEAARQGKAAVLTQVARSTAGSWRVAARSGR